MSAIAAIEEAITLRLLNVWEDRGVFRVPVDYEQAVPYVSFGIYSPGVDDVTICGTAAVRHLTFRVMAWARDSDVVQEEEAVDAAGAIVLLLENWQSTAGSYRFACSMVQESTEVPLPTDPLPLVRGYGAFWRFDVTG